MGKCRRPVSVLVAACAVLSAATAHATPDGPAPPPGYSDRSGLGELVAWQGFNGLIAGSLLGSALFAKKANVECQTTENMMRTSACKSALARGGGVGVLGLAAGISLPFLLTKGQSVKTADVILINRSTLIGFMHGYILPLTLGARPDDIDDIAVLHGLAFTGDVIGVGVGTYLASQYDLTPGRASFLGTIHLATYLAGTFVGHSLPDKVDLDDERIIQGVSLGLADVALAVVLAMPNKIDVGRNRVFWLDAGTSLGAMAGIAAGTIIGGDEERVPAVGGALGMAAGLVLAYWATDGDEPWRQRHEFKLAGTRFSLDAPGFRVEPTYHGMRSEMKMSLDVVRGRF